MIANGFFILVNPLKGVRLRATSHREGHFGIALRRGISKF